jgi:Spy/CpxP family protein refolding chaperone
MKLPLLVKAAGLTEAQQAQVRQIVQSHRPQFQGLVSQLRAAHTQLADKLYGPGPVKAEDLAPLTQQIAQLRGQLAQEGLQVALEIRGVLTAEQLAKAGHVRQRFNELRAEMKGLLGAGQ